MAAPITQNQLILAQQLPRWCANHGVIDTTGTLTAPNGQPASGGRFHCICPNGQAMKRGGHSL